MLESLSLEVFRPLVGDPFQARTPGGTLELVLSEATALLARPSGPQPFSLILHEAGGVHVPQGSYPLSHAELGEFDLFIVPLGPDAGGMRYEAVFG